MTIKTIHDLPKVDFDCESGFCPFAFLSTVWCPVFGQITDNHTHVCIYDYNKYNRKRADSKAGD